MHFSKINLILFIILVLIFSYGVAQELSKEGTVIEKIGEQGQIDWSGGFIYATGIGLPPEGEENTQYGKTAARQAAIVDAQKNLAEIVYGVRIDSYTLVKDSILSNTVTKTSVEGFIRGAQPVSFKFTKEGAAEATLRLALNGKEKLSDLLFPCPEPRIIDNWEIILPPDTYKDEKNDTLSNHICSGIIFNAKGKSVKPSLNPEIYSADSKLVHGIKQADLAIVEGNGLVGWCCDSIQARTSCRVAKYPRVFMVQATSGKQGTDFIISNEDAAILLSDKKFSYLLHHCKVLVLID